MDSTNTGRELTNGKSISFKTGKRYGISLPQMAKNQMLPTPTAMDSNAATAKIKSTQIKKGSMHSVTLSRMILNTPTTSANKKKWKTDKWKGSDLGSQINEIFGTRSHLNPLFVEEMMGFPKDWTTLPFLNGETNQSKHTVTQ
jgi:hypothetical protein